MDTAHKLKNFITIASSRDMDAVKDGLNAFADEIAIVASVSEERKAVLFRDMSAIYMARLETGTALMAMGQDSVHSLFIQYIEHNNTTPKQMLKDLEQVEENGDIAKVVTAQMREAFIYLSQNEDKFINKERG